MPLVHFAKGCWDFNCLPTTGFSISPLRVDLFAGEPKATEAMVERPCPEKHQDDVMESPASGHQRSCERG